MGDVVRMKHRGRVVGSSPSAGRQMEAVRGFTSTRVAALAALLDDGQADTLDVLYRCMAGHDLVIRFAADACVPRLWECTVHREPAPLADPAVVEAAGAALADEADVATSHVPKSHWEHVRARRSTDELEALLQERLTLLRARRGGV